MAFRSGDEAVQARLRELREAPAGIDLTAEGWAARVEGNEGDIKMAQDEEPFDRFSDLPRDGSRYVQTYHSNWRYEQRREAQEIIPNLYLGPYQSSNKLEVLLGMGITHILCVRDKREASLVYPRFPDRFQYLTMDIADHRDQNIISIFPMCKDFFEHALNNRGRVLAHCNGGISTSPAIVIGYLMWKYGMSYEDTLNYVQNKRYCISPTSFQVQLKEYEPITIAQKMMEATGGVNIGNRAQKRLMEDDGDEDETRHKVHVVDPDP